MSTFSDAKVALITGATSGLGKSTALAMAKQGWLVVFTARDPQKGEVTRQEIIHASGNSEVAVMLVDVSSQTSIREFATVFSARYSRLHLLVNNVGNSFTTRQISVDGIEMSLAVNHLAPFLLTHLLLPVLQQSTPSRIVNVGTRLNTAMDFDDLQWERRRFRGLSAYAQSKLGNLHFTFALARRLQASGVTVNCVHPGVFRSGLGSTGGDIPFLLKWITGMAQPFLASSDTATKRVVYVALSPELEGMTGKYFGNRQQIEPPPQTLDVSAQERLWQISETLTGLAS
jgi:NAD(P)-dependent dehydrogenase (short-subunit alcohol dehydrogenase family)